MNGGGECPRAAEAARGHADVPNVDPAPLGAAASWSPTGSPAQSTPAVAIVGGGASGALLAAQLLRQDHPAGARVILIERRFEVGRGVAYSTTHPDHRLNVPAEEMGVHPGDQRHFVRWAERRGTPLGARDFAPRRTFGDYLIDVLADAELAARPGVSLEVVRGEAVEIRIADSRRVGARPVTIALADGGEVAADRAVLAVGNLVPAMPPGADPEILASGRYEPDPWDAGVASRAAGDRSILLLGTGLTMVDVALTIAGARPDARLHAVSRTGLLPHRHNPGPSVPARLFGPIPLHPSLDDLVRRIRAEVAAAVREGGDWRGVIDSLRPVTNEIWTRLSDVDRRRFVQRFARHWDVHRHRMAPEVASLLGELRSTGRLTVEAANCAAMRADRDGIEVDLMRAGARGVEVRRFDRVINCTGPASDLRDAGEPLLDRLFESGLACPGPLGMGLDHDVDGAVVGADGHVSPYLFVIGPLRRGRLWETTAIPEIREQAAELAGALSAELARAARPPAHLLAS